MGYIDKHLAPGERVIYQTKLHWIAYRVVINVLLLGLFCYILMLGSDQYDKAAPDAIYIAGVVAVVVAFETWIKRVTTEIGVTNRRVIEKIGLIWRTIMEMNASKIESVVINQTVVGRLLGYGTVALRGTGAGIEPVRNVANPMKLRAAVAQISDDAANLSSL